MNYTERSGVTQYVRYYNNLYHVQQNKRSKIQDLEVLVSKRIKIPFDPVSLLTTVHIEGSREVFVVWFIAYITLRSVMTGAV